MVTNTILTTNASSLFLMWLETASGELLEKLLAHPGYRAVLDHSGTWGSAITADDVIKAAAGLPSPMYGLGGVRENAASIRAAIGYVEANRAGITSLVEEALARLFAPELISPLELHCIVGYDWGIGLNGRVAINLNSRLYLGDFREIGYMLIHEAAHVAYEREHGALSPRWMREPGGLRRLVNTLVQNEGLAVYSSLRARIEGQCLDNRDYRLLLDPSALSEKISALKPLLNELPDEYPGEGAFGQILDKLSGDRLSYVVGCAAFTGLEKQGGLPLVREAARWDPQDFVARAVQTL